MDLKIGDKITVNKIGYKVYDLDGNYICLKCTHAYLKNKQCLNCGAKKTASGFTDGLIDREYKDSSVSKIVKLIS